MKVGVVIERKNYYRLLAPIVDAALAQGWEVVCLHDHAQPRTGMKRYEFPAVESVPDFLHGTPRVEIYHGGGTLPEAIRKAGLDAIVSIVPPPNSCHAERSFTAKWISLQYAGEIVTHFMPPVARAVSIYSLYSPWWLEFGLKVLRAEGITAPGDGLEREIRRKSVVVGFPEMDQFQTIEPAEVRRRWRIPSEKPVVVFLPYPFRSNPRTPWSRWVYPARNRVWKRMRLRLSGERRLESMIARGWDDLAVTRAVRAFCDANGAHLVVKAREKDPVPRYLLHMSDVVVYDQGNYPPTILEVLAAADLCVHFYSGAVIEAVACGVPSLSICPELDDMGATTTWHQLLYMREEGSVFQFRGIAETIGISEAVEELPRKRLTDFTAEPAARKAYTEKFLGFDDGRSSARLLDLVREHAEGASA